MKITAVSSPVYSKEDNSQIDCVITCALGTVPFTARSDDPMRYGRQLFNDLISGKHGAIGEYVAPQGGGQ